MSALEPEQLTPSPASAQVGEDERFRLMADHAPVMLWMSGTDGLCEFFNATWLAFTGRNLEQERGSGWAEGVHPEDFQELMEAYLQAVAERRAFRIQYRLRRADGEYRWILDHGVPRFAQSGTFEGFIGSCVDITEMREAREAVQSRTEELLSALREREVLLGEIHHRVKNNLQLISSMLALQARSAGEETRTALAIGQRRIDVIGLLHEQLYASGNLSSINFGRYLEALLPRLCRTGAVERVAVRQELAGRRVAT